MRLFILATVTGAIIGAPLLAAPVTVSGNALRVVDGDTVELRTDLGRERIRLLDVDAPELHGPRCQAEQIPALVARTRLEALLAGGSVTVERRGTDRYGRTLARLQTGAGDAGHILLSEGLALSYEPGRQAWRWRCEHWCPGAPRCDQ